MTVVVFSPCYYLKYDFLAFFFRQMLMDSSGHKNLSDAPKDLAKLLGDPSFRQSVAECGRMAARPNQTVAHLAALTKEGVSSFKECAQMLQTLYASFFLFLWFVLSAFAVLIA